MSTDDETHELIPLIRWDTRTMSLADGSAAGLVALAPPGCSVPAGYEPAESLEWGVRAEQLPELLDHFDIMLTRRDGRPCGYLSDKGAGFPGSGPRMG